MNKGLNKLYEKADVTLGKHSLRVKDFTIISNNCWAGFMYQKHHLPYLSPTIGLMIFGDDFINFCRDLKRYVKEELVFIPFETSKAYPMMKGCNPFPVGVLGDIEIYFLHYASEREAKEKWERRCKRINWEKIIYKVSQRESFSGEHMKQFLNIAIKNKLCFTTEKIDGGIFIPELKTLVGDETPVIEKYFDEIEYLNCKL